MEGEGRAGEGGAVLSLKWVAKGEGGEGKGVEPGVIGPEKGASEASFAAPAMKMIPGKRNYAVC